LLGRAFERKASQSTGAFLICWVVWLAQARVCEWRVTNYTAITRAVVDGDSRNNLIPLLACCSHTRAGGQRATLTPSLPPGALCYSRLRRLTLRSSTGRKTEALRYVSSQRRPRRIACVPVGVFANAGFAMLSLLLCYTSIFLSIQEQSIKNGR
jgi:hypothetical protein